MTMKWIRWVAVLLILVALGMQLPYLLTAWRGAPTDRLDALYWGLALLVAVTTLLLHPPCPAVTDRKLPEWFALFPASILLLVLVFGVAVSIRLAVLASLTGLLSCTIWWGWGWRWFWRFLPITGLLLLGLPSTGYLVFLPWKIVQWKVLYAVLLLVWGAFALWGQPRRPRSVEVIALMWTLGLIVLIAFSRYDFKVGAGFEPNLNQVRIDGYLGGSVPLSTVDRRFFAGCATSERYVFYAPSGEIAALVLTSGDSIHSVHSAGVCLTAAGWQLEKDEVDYVKFGSRTVAVNRLVVKRPDGGRALFFCWYAQGSRTVGDFLFFRTLWRPGSTWKIYQLSTVLLNDDPEEANQRLVEFLTAAENQEKGQF